jgi:MFS family permease
MNPDAATSGPDADAIDVPFVLGLSLVQLISWGSVFYGFSLFMSPLESALGMNRASSSLAFSLALLAEGAAAYAVGRWIDQGRAQAVMSAGSVLLGLALIALAQVHRVWQFYAVWVVLGLGMAATLYTPAFAVLTQRFAQHYRRAIIILSFLGGLASTVFIPLIALLIQTWGWRHAVWVLGLTHLLLCAPLHHWLLRPLPSAAHRDAPVRPSPSTIDAPHTAAQASLHVHLKNPNFWLIAVFMVLLMAVTTAVPAHILPLLEGAGLPSGWVLFAAAAIGVLQVLGRLLLFLSDTRLSLHRSNRWVPGLVPLGLLMLWLGSAHGDRGGSDGVTGALVVAALFVLFYGMGNGMLTIVKGTVVAQYVSHAHVGRLNGVVHLPMALARAAAPWLLGLMWQPEQGYRTGLLVLVALSCVGVAALWWAQARVLGKQAFRA